MRRHQGNERPCRNVSLKVMKKLHLIGILTVFVSFTFGVDALAQKAQRTGSAKAAYGYPAEMGPAKSSKKKKSKKKKSRKSVKKSKAPLERRGGPWVLNVAEPRRIAV